MIETTRQIEKEVTRIKLPLNKKCRGAQHHYSVHSPKHDIEFCKKCDAYVEVIDVEIKKELKKGICRCCGNKTIKHQKKVWLTRVLKTGIRQHHNFIRDWCMFPEGCESSDTKPRISTSLNGEKQKIIEVFTKKPKRTQYVEIKYKGTVYEIQIKYLILYLEPINEQEKLDIIGKKISIKGYRITYPEEEEMDENCIACNTKLKYNLDNQIFCPRCNGGHNLF